MSIKGIYCSFVFFLTMMLAAEGSTDIINLKYPPDNTIMEFGIIGISLNVRKDSADLIKVNVNNERKATVIPDSEFECFSVKLANGINKITILAIKKDSIVDWINFRVFNRSDLESAYRNPPAGFRRDYFHMTEHSRCASCHALEPGEFDKKSMNIASSSLKIPARMTAAVSTCYPCHKDITAFSNVHGPASVWSCLSCHDPDTALKYSVKKPESETCYRCHVEQKNDWTAKKYIHGPVNTGKCTICHNPHASENRFVLYKPIWNLCVGCHVNSGTGKHIFTGFNERGHPTKDRPDPLRKGKELSCSSCHNPHASNSQRLWALNADNAFDLCRKCHSRY